MHFFARHLRETIKAEGHEPLREGHWSGLWNDLVNETADKRQIFVALAAICNIAVGGSDCYFMG
jgi:hypothetical protein